MDPEAAFMPAVSAAMLGHADTQYKLGLLYGTGETVEQDLILAHVAWKYGIFRYFWAVSIWAKWIIHFYPPKDNVKLVLDSLIENLTLQQVLGKI